jgi:hypothetical protein
VRWPLCGSRDGPDALRNVQQPVHCGHDVCGRELPPGVCDRANALRNARNVCLGSERSCQLRFVRRALCDESGVQRGVVQRDVCRDDVRRGVRRSPERPESLRRLRNDLCARAVVRVGALRVHVRAHVVWRRVRQYVDR